MKRRDFISFVASASGLAGSGLLSPAFARALPPDPFYGNRFPDPDGSQQPLIDFLGQPLVLNFWATWCPPCIKEMPDLDALHRKYPGIHMVGLAVDSAVNVVKFSDKVKVDYPILVAGHGGISLMRDLGNKKGGLPFTVIFDANGRVVQRILGQVDAQKLDAFLGDMS